MCLGKLAIFKEANLKPRIEGKKVEDEFEFSSITLFFPAAGVWSALMEIGIQYIELLSKAFTKFLKKMLLPFSLRCSPLLLRQFPSMFWCLIILQSFWLQYFIRRLLTAFTASFETLSDLDTSSDRITSALDSISIFLARSTIFSATTVGEWSRRSFVPTWRIICCGFLSTEGIS